MFRRAGPALNVLEGRPHSAADNVSAAMCFAYAGGYVDAVKIIGDLNGHAKPESLCVPDEATTEQVVRVWLKYLRQSPEVLHESARLTLALALSKSFRCR